MVVAEEEEVKKKKEGEQKRERKGDGGEGEGEGGDGGQRVPAGIHQPLEWFSSTMRYRPSGCLNEKGG